jgi:hypothetical protein
METTIEVAGVHKRNGRMLALDGMAFAVSPGQVTGFVGPNEAGKSTTMPGMRQRLGAAALLIGAVALLTACSGGSPSPNASSTPGSSIKGFTQALAFSKCMRSNGVTNFPDPTVHGNQVAFAYSGSGGGNKTLEQTAQKACEHLLPNGGAPSSGQQAQSVQNALKIAQCMRKHGYPNFPDPSANGSLDLAGTGINTKSSTFQSAVQTCSKQAGGGQSGGSVGISG